MATKFLDGIRAAMYDAPTDYNESREYYTETLQQKINETYEWSPDTFEIERETGVGTLEFKPLVCRVTHAIDPKTGSNLGDDFKNLIFFDLSGNYIMGERYKFNNSIWITTNTDNYKYVTKSAIVRRCNNELRWVDLETKQVVSEPCIVDYALKYANIYYNNTVDITQGTITVYAQYNNNTKKIFVNDRFVLGSQVYKVKTITDVLRSKTYEQNTVPIITFQLYVDNIAADDNFAEDSEQYNPKYPPNIANCSKYDSLYNSNITGDTDIIVNPEIATIYLGEEQTFECYKTVDGVKRDTEFDFVFSGIADTYYTATIIDGNHFSVKNLKPNTRRKLNIAISEKDGEKVKQMQLTLGGVF